MAIDDLQQYFTGVRSFFSWSNYDDVAFPLLQHLSSSPNTKDDVEQSPALSGITVEGDFGQVNGDSIQSDNLFVC